MRTMRHSKMKILAAFLTFFFPFLYSIQQFTSDTSICYVVTCKLPIKEEMLLLGKNVHIQ